MTSQLTISWIQDAVHALSFIYLFNILVKQFILKCLHKESFYVRAKEEEALLLPLLPGEVIIKLLEKMFISANPLYLPRWGCTKIRLIIFLLKVDILLMSSIQITSTMGVNVFSISNLYTLIMICVLEKSDDILNFQEW